jgi:hypothetical protein
MLVGMRPRHRARRCPWDPVVVQMRIAVGAPSWGGLYLTGHLRCRATPHASFGSRGLSHGCPRK